MATKADLQAVADELRDAVRSVREERDALFRDLVNECRLHQEERKGSGSRIATLLHLVRVQHDETTAATVLNLKMTDLLQVQERTRECILEVSNATMDLWKKTSEREAVQKDLADLLQDPPSQTPKPEPKNDSAVSGLGTLF